MPRARRAATILEPGQVPGAFQQAFHLMRSGRPGPVLIDLPLDVQMAEIEFDPDTYEPLPVHRPRFRACRPSPRLGPRHQPGLYRHRLLQRRRLPLRPPPWACPRRSEAFPPLKTCR